MSFPGGKIFIPAALFLFLLSCKGKEELKDYSARVEKDYLSPHTVDSVLTTERYRNYYKEEFINKWVQDRIFYNEAVKKGILESDEYKNLVAGIKEEAAISLYLKRINDDFDLSYTQDDLKNFYKENAEEFRTGDDAYVFNEIKFVSYDKAVQFRQTLMESGWDHTIKVFAGDPTIRSSAPKRFLMGNQIQPYEIYKLIVNMQENDVSILTETEPGVFAIVQLVKSYLKESIPDFEFISDLVKDRFLMQKRKILLNEIIQDLYSKYDIEIKKDK